MAGSSVGFMNSVDRRRLRPPSLKTTKGILRPWCNRPDVERISTGSSCERPYDDISSAVIWTEHRCWHSMCEWCGQLIPFGLLTFLFLTKKRWISIMCRLAIHALLLCIISQWADQVMVKSPAVHASFFLPKKIKEKRPGSASLKENICGRK
jgi:hypothetical protein